MNFEKDQRISDLYSNLNNSQVYIKRKDKYERLFDYTSFFYLDKDKMQIYQLSDSTIFDKRNITQQELDENYISLDELLDISEYVGKWMLDVLSGKKEYIYYKADGYIIYQCLDSENISIIITPPEHHNCEQKDTPFISDEFKDKKVMQDLIEKQMKKRIKEKEKKFLPPSPHPYAEDYLSNINNNNNNNNNNSRKRR